MLNKRPKKTKYTRYHKGRISYNKPILNENKLEKIEKEIEKEDLIYKLIALEPLRLKASHISAGELAIKRELKNSGSINIILEGERKTIKGELILKQFPHIPVTKKPVEVRMGKGKGSIDYWMTRIKIGSPIFELRFKWIKKLNNPNIENRCFNIAKNSLDIANSKLPIKTKIISNS